MLPSNMELRIKTGTVGYNNKILVSDGKFSLGKNDEVNSLETPAIESHLNTTQGLTHTPTISHKMRKLPLSCLLLAALLFGFSFDESPPSDK